MSSQHHRENIFSRVRRWSLETIKRFYISRNGIIHASFPDIKLFRNVVNQVKKQAHYYHKPIPLIRFEGRVKIHGSNMSICRKGSGGKMWAQSRNQIIHWTDPAATNYGFYKFFKSYEEVFDGYMEWIHAAFPLGLPYGPNTVTTIYGEWAGQEIMGGAAIAQVPPAFYIFGISFSINTVDAEELRKSQVWVDSELAKAIHHQWKAIEEEFYKPLDIYCIHDFAKWTLDIDFNRPEEAQQKLVEFTLQVERECPVAKARGVTGLGEGIVWTPHAGDIPSWLRAREDLTFKVKGAKHSPTNVSTLAAPNAEKMASVKDFVSRTVTDVRCEQGLEALKQQGLPINFQNTSKFVKWVCNDVLKEDRDILEASELNEKEAMQYIAREAMAWYKGRVA